MGMQASLTDMQHSQGHDVPCGRMAPSPTGYLHLGNAWSFLLAWLAMRSCGGKIILRMEDIDPQRSKPKFEQAIIEDLQWLGLDWDEGPGMERRHAPCRQSLRTDKYLMALEELHGQGYTYPCFCTRKELRLMASAPHIGDEGVAYSGKCRRLSAEERQLRMAEGQPSCIRLQCPEDEPICFFDLVMGEQGFRFSEVGGDFAIRRSDGVFAYQLAVAVDDGLMGITQVIRGRDILPSTPRQILLMHLLGHPIPQYAHVPLLLDETGQRLAKRHSSLALRSLRQQGVSPQRIIGLLSLLWGQNPGGESLNAKDLTQQFSIGRIPATDITLTSRHINSLLDTRSFYGRSHPGLS